MSKSKSETARINGAKSNGPVTPEGKARSAANSLRHGLSAKLVVLPHENPADFERLRDSYLARFRPADQVEHDLVETLATTRWRLNRLVTMESDILEKEMALRADDIAKEGFDQMSPEETMAWCFDRLCNREKSISTLIRYEGQLNRTYERALKQLVTLQATRPEPQPGDPIPNTTQALVPAPPPQQNEPKPVPLEPCEPAPAPPPNSAQSENLLKGDPNPAC